MPHLKNREIIDMANTQGDRFLRRVSACGLIWGIAFLVPYGVRATAPVVFCLLIPLGLSFFCAAYHLSNKATCRVFNLALDTSLGLSTLGMLIAASITITRQSRRWNNIIEPSFTMVGTLGTVPAIVNWFVCPRRILYLTSGKQLTTT